MRALSLAALALALVACGEGRHGVREWRPSDHQPPPDDHSGQGDDGDGEQAPQADESTAAAMLWQTSCAPCHGADGHGDGPSKPPIARLPDFADAGFQSSRTDEQLGLSITNGRGMMPGFGSQLSPTGIAVLVMYVRALGAATGAPPPMAPPPGAPPPMPTAP